MSVRVSGKRGENMTQDAHCLGDKFMKPAHKILEDELTRSPPHVHQQIWCELDKLEQICRDDLWLIRVLRVPAQHKTEYRL